MLNIFNKIEKIQSAKTQKGNLSTRVWRYLLYAIGEIILIVVGILLALQINNWNTLKIEKKNEIKSYQNIKRQIIDDKNELLKIEETNNYFSAQYQLANQIISEKNYAKTDTLALIMLSLSQYSDFHRSGNIYETLVNSGDIKLLKNSDITSQLQRVETTYTNLNKLEDIHWEIIINEFSPEIKGVISYSTMQVIQPEKLFSVEIQNFIIESIFLTKGKEAVYKKALTEIEVVIDLIDKELNK